LGNRGKKKKALIASMITAPMIDRLSGEECCFWRWGLLLGFTVVFFLAG
jgi:hypothetical protein